MNDNPLTNLVEYVHVLTLAIFPRRRARIKNHLLIECGIDEDRIVFHQGKPLESVTERYADKEMSILDIVTLNPSVVNDDVAQNIYENHLAMIRRVYNSLPDHVQWALFMEDDAKIEKDVFTMNQSQWTRRFLMSYPNADVLLLGCIVYCGNPPFPASVYVEPYIVKNISRTLTAHAYILTRQGMQKILHFAETKAADSSNGICRKTPPFDQVFHEADMRVYTMFPMVCYPCREPAMYRRFQHMVTVCHMVSFQQVTKFMMVLSLILPVFITILFLWTTVTITLLCIKRVRALRNRSRV